MKAPVAPTLYRIKPRKGWQFSNPLMKSPLPPTTPEVTLALSEAKVSEPGFFQENLALEK